MKKAIDITIDANLIDKNRFEVKQWTGKDGEVKSARNMNLVVVPLKEERVKSTGDTWELVQIGFVTQKPTKTEKEAQTNLPIIGSATQFRSTEEIPNFNKDSQGRELTGYPNSFSSAKEEAINPEDIPF